MADNMQAIDAMQRALEVVRFRQDAALDARNAMDSAMQVLIDDLKQQEESLEGRINDALRQAVEQRNKGE